VLLLNLDVFYAFGGVHSGGPLDTVEAYNLTHGGRVLDTRLAVANYLFACGVA
jgi:hypothetical protein